MGTVLLFDVDGTLILTGGAGMRAMGRAFEDVFSITNAFDGIPMPGRTDTLIVSDALRRSAVAADDPRLALFRTRYITLLHEELARPHRDKRVMPGVRPLLDELTRRDHVCVALLTGNFSEAARVKLSYFDLWRYFRFGAYGEDASDRNALVSVALARAASCGFRRVSPRDVIVVGDTPHDVACAAAAGVRCIAVATGFSRRRDLVAAGADIVLDDLSDTAAFLSFVDNPAA